MQHESHRCPVTALAFLSKDTLLAGEGNYLKAYKTDPNNQHFHRIKAFESQAVHGILSIPVARVVLVWGGRYLRLLTFTDEGNQVDFVLGKIYCADDWILDVACGPLRSGFDASRVAGLITAHNALWVLRIENIWDVSDGRVPDGSLELAVSGSNCILYSAHVTWLSVSHCLIASGTAFGDVILWSAFFDDHSAVRTQVHFTFSAHEGSVFGVQISSLLKLPDEDKERRLLATCSDDRTIRLWDISDLSTESPTLTQIQRDTGFGSTPDADAHAPPLLAKVMGHTSRIWHVRFLQDTTSPEDASPKILSCGEDSFANTWQLKRGSSDPPYELQLLNSKSSHSGKNIWSVAQHEREGLVTGGADGAIAWYPKLSKHGRISEISRNRLRECDPDGRDHYKVYAFTSFEKVIATTEQGRVVALRPPDLEGHVKELSPPLPGLRGYSVATSLLIPSYASHELFATAFLSGTDGVIYCAPRTGNALLKLAKRSGKTAGLLTAVLGMGQHCMCLLAVGVGPASATLYTLHHRSSSGERAVWPPFENDGLYTAQLALPEAFMVTSFAVNELDDGSCYAFIGSRSGSILIYHFDAHKSAEQLVAPCYTKELVHGKEAVTAVDTKRCRSVDGAPHPTFLLSTGRDGTLAIHRVSFASPSPEQHPDRPGHKSPSLELVHQLPLPLGPNLEGFCIWPNLNDHLHAWGFRGKRFVVYDTHNQQEWLSVECGGAHRNWTFRPSHGRRGGTFMWTKAGKVYHYEQRERPCRVIDPGSHGREIKAMAVSEKFTDKDGVEREIVATGAEDTDIKLFHLNSPHSSPQTDGDGLRCLHTLRKHNTGIQHLAWNGSYLFSSGGFEEFYIWKLTMDVPCFAVGVVCVSAHPRCGKSDLRVCGFDVQRFRRDRDGWEGFEIYMAYSDSTLKLWGYSIATSEWELRRQGDYLTSCLTHVLRTANDERSLTGHTCREILTAVTDGHLVLWRSSVDKLWWPGSKRHKVHQSAIHALTSTTLADLSTLVVTGGDDNAIALTLISPSGSEMETLLIPKAHAAAVTGLALVPLRIPGHSGHNGESEGESRAVFYLVSASIDQRLKLWRLTISFEPSADFEDEVDIKGIDAVEVEKVQNVFTCIADVSSLELCTLEDGGRGVVVGGVGMDVWRLPADAGVDQEEEEEDEEDDVEDGVENVDRAKR